MKIVKEEKLTLDAVDALVIPVFETRDLHPLCDRYPEIKESCQRSKFNGKAGKAMVFNSTAKKKLMIAVGAGKSRHLPDTVKLSQKIISVLKQEKIERAIIHFPPPLQRLKSKAGSRFWVNFLDFLFISDYRFETYKKAKKEREKIEQINIYIEAPDSQTLLPPGVIRERQFIAQQVRRVRDLVNEPPSKVNPDSLVEEFKKVANENQLECLIYRQKELQYLGLGGILAVGQASPYEPALIRLRYQPEKSSRSLALIGKGITFDAGGLNLKSRGGMTGMKSDMSGAAAVLGIMAAVPRLQPPIRIDAFVPVAENLPGQHAYKPGDILTFKNKKSVEVVDTDAEGRLLLADALLTAAREKPDSIVEMSTLTGAVVSALGEGIAGVMGNNEHLVSLLGIAGRQTGERLWPLPLVEDYKESIQSRVADLKNEGYGRASAIKAALFLNEFTGNIPFAHIDIAGTAFLHTSNAYYPEEGATGFGVRLILEFLTLYTKKTKKLTNKGFNTI
jgi:leucyl aminopeptidase